MFRHQFLRTYCMPCAECFEQIISIDKMLWNISTAIMNILQWEENEAQRISDLPKVAQSSNQHLQLMCWGQHRVWWDEFRVKIGGSIKWRLLLSYFHSHKAWSNLETAVLLPIFSPYSFCFQPLHNFSMTSHFMKEYLKSASWLVIQFYRRWWGGWGWTCMCGVMEYLKFHHIIFSELLLVTEISQHEMSQFGLTQEVARHLTNLSELDII